MNVQMIFQLILAILGAVVTIVVIPLIRKKASSEDVASIMLLVDMAVKAAEQRFQGQGKGAQKKQYVLKYLKDKGINVDDRDLDNMIEASVLELNRWREEIEKATPNG